MKSSKPFPKVIHVTRECEGTEDEILYVSECDTAEGALKSTKRMQVATYELKEVKEGRLEPVFTTVIR